MAKKTIEGKCNESNGFDIHTHRAPTICNGLRREERSLKQFPKVFNRDGKAYGVLFTKNLNSVTQQEPEENDCDNDKATSASTAEFVQQVLRVGGWQTLFLRHEDVVVDIQAGDNLK